jgi:hypothetical protein
LWKKALERSPGMGAAHFFLALAEKDAGRPASVRSEAALAQAGAQTELLKSLAGDLLKEPPKKR